VVGVRTRWDAAGKLLNGGFALDFKKSSPAAVRVRRRLAVGASDAGSSAGPDSGPGGSQGSGRRPGDGPAAPEASVPEPASVQA
jgi:hypothetical protein